MKERPVVAYYPYEINDHARRKFDNILEAMRWCTPYRLAKQVSVTAAYTPSSFYSDLFLYDEDADCPALYTFTTAIFPSMEDIKNRKELLREILDQGVAVASADQIDDMFKEHIRHYDDFLELLRRGRHSLESYNDDAYHAWQTQIRHNALYWNDGQEHFGYKLSNPLDSTANPSELVAYIRSDGSCFMCLAKDDPRFCDPHLEREHPELFSSKDERAKSIEFTIRAYVLTAIDDELVERLCSNIECIVQNSHAQLVRFYNASSHGMKQSSRKSTGENERIWAAICMILESVSGRIREKEIPYLLAKRNLMHTCRVPDGSIINNGIYKDDNGTIHKVIVSEGEDPNGRLSPGIYKFAEGSNDKNTRTASRMATVYYEKPYTDNALSNMITSMGKRKEWDELWKDHEL